MATQVGLGLLVALGRSPMHAALYTTREGNDTRRRNRAAVINQFFQHRDPISPGSCVGRAHCGVTSSYVIMCLLMLVLFFSGKLQTQALAVPFCVSPWTTSKPSQFLSASLISSLYFGMPPA